MKTSDPNQLMYDRIDDVLKTNTRNEIIVITLSAMIFIIGLILILVGLMKDQPFIYGTSLLIEGLLYWPINKILTIRKENIALAAAPALISALPPDQAATEMVKLLEKVNG